MSVRIVVAVGEPIGAALRRFKKHVERTGLPWDIRRRAYYTRGSEVRRAKEFRKLFKTRKAALLAKMAGILPTSSVAEAHAEFWRRTGKP